MVEDKRGGSNRGESTDGYLLRPPPSHTVKVCPDGGCSGSDCQKVGCYGTRCIGGTGLCLSPGCDRRVFGPGESDCETSEADICTEYISSSLEPVASTYTTTTSTACQTITACDAEPSTTTTTISDHVAVATPHKYYHWTLDPVVASSVASSIEKDFSSLHATTTTTTTTSRTTTKPTSTTASTTTDAFSPAETELSCQDNSWMCGHFTGGNFRAFCDVAKSYLRGNEIYGTTSQDSDTGACYTDGRHLGGGCGVFVEGDGCRLRGTTMQAAYDHLENPDQGGCGACGHVFFDNGCKMTVNYVSTCGTVGN
ncbi:hypothetical protein GB937_010025 [Aspergillus fischeri]|nr:hypothetical protein GB937_010025 [Aspergillus fischeri]